MTYYNRLLGDNAQNTLARGKSVLLLGPRQTGKTTFVQKQLNVDLEISFVQASNRLRYEREPELLEYEITSYTKTIEKKPIIFIDEVQKIPTIMDTLQYVIDKKQAQFILSGSSARKLKSGKNINLLPGRVVLYNLSPLVHEEIKNIDLSLEDRLLYGTLPGIITESNKTNKEEDLRSYVTTYLQDEIRAESITRNIGHFSKFLQLAAGESNQQINLTKISQEVGVAASTIANYFDILVDCMITHKIEPIIKTTTKRRLIKSVKYLFFDLGIRRACANEGVRLPSKILGDLFEQFVGLELISYANLKAPQAKIRYWRDSAGPEIDYVIETPKGYIPIEVKYSEAPTTKDARHLNKFMEEYDNVLSAYIVSRTPRRYTLKNGVHIIPWQEINTLFDELKNE